MKNLRIYITILITALIVAVAGIDADAAARKSKSGKSTKTRTTATTRTSKGKSSRTPAKKKGGTSSRTSRSGRTSRTSRTSRRATRSSRRTAAPRATWSPFRTYETMATPTPYYIAEDSIASLRRKAAEGNREAQYLLGCAYFEQHVRGANPDSTIYHAAAYWRDAAELGHVTAMGDYAYCLRTGRGVPADTMAAIDMYVKSLVKGNKRLLKLTRQNAAHGSGMDAYIMAQAAAERADLAAPGMTPQAYEEIAVNSTFTHAVVARAIDAINADNPQLAAELLRPAAPRLRSAAVNRLLAALNERNIDSIELLTVLAESDNPDAQYALGHELALRGKADEAAMWMHRAATGGSDEALEAYITDLVDGAGIKRDYWQAYMWLDVLAGEKDTEVVGESERLKLDPAFVEWARALTAIRHSDYADALVMLQPIAADNPEASSLEMLCRARTDKKSGAAKRLKQAAQKGQPMAAYAYSLLYTRDARKVLKAAADAGDIAAAEQLGIILQVKKEYDEAYKILDRIDETAVLSPEGAKALAECIAALRQ